MSLLRQIQDAAVDPLVDLPTLLRKCKILATRLGNEDLKQWVDHELHGYGKDDELPKYRIFEVNSKGHFTGAFGSSISNADIPLSSIPKHFREGLREAHLRQSVASIASFSLTQNPSSTLQIPWNPDLVALVGSNIYEHHVCMQAWKVIPSSALVGTLDSIRSSILNFALEIEAKNPAAGEAMINEKPVSQEAVTKIFNTTINGNVQNVSTGSNNVSQHAENYEVQDAEFFANFLDTITKARLPSTLETEVLELIKELKESSRKPGFKEQYSRLIALLSDHVQLLGPIVTPLLPALTALLG